jgi:hypothetical protein
MQPMVLVELIISIYVPGHTKRLFSETSSEVKNSRLQLMHPLIHLGRLNDRGACAK